MVTVVIQAGGRSSRMGQDKGLVLLAGRALVEHVLARVDGLGDEVLITTNNPAGYAYLGMPLASDATPGAGALPGLQTALQAAHGDHVLVVACDMPFLNRPLLAHLLSLAPQADVVVPQWADRYQTLHAVYARRPCLAAVTQALAAGEKRLISFYPQVQVRAVTAAEVAEFDPAGRTFFNVNTPDDLAEARRHFDDARPTP